MGGLFVLSAWLVAPLTLVAASKSPGENAPGGDEANQAKQVVVKIHEGNKGFANTTETLTQGILLEFKDAPMSEVIDHLSTARGLRFRFDSTDIGKERVSISASSAEVRGLTLRDVLLSLFEHFNCEMAILPNGDIQVTPVSPQA